MLVFNYPLIQHHIPGKWNPQLHGCENLKTGTVDVYYVCTWLNI